METRVLTMMLTDIKGFTERTSATSRRALGHLLDEHERILYPIFRHYGGTLVKTIGDALLITFESPTNAVLCGLAMQEHLRLHNDKTPEADRLFIRIAVNTGEVQIRDGDVFGEAVNITARIEGITDVGEIYFTEAVYLAMNKAEVPTSEIGQKRLKGLPEAIKVYKVIQDSVSEDFLELLDEIRELDLEPAAAPEPSSKAPDAAPAGEAPGATPVAKTKRKRPFIYAAAAVVFVAIVIAAAFKFWPDPLKSSLAKLDDALGANDFARATTVVDHLLAMYPGDTAGHTALGRTVRAETALLLKAKEFRKILKLINGAEEKYAPRKFDGLRKQTLLAFGAEEAKDWNYRTLAPIYGELLTRYKDDPVVLVAVMTVMGAGAKDRPARVALNAAIIALENDRIPIDEVTAQLTFAYLAKAATDPNSKNAKKYRALLSQRYNEFETMARARLHTGLCRDQMHPYLILRETDRLKAKDRLKFSFLLLHDRCRGARNLKPLIAEAAALVNESANRPDWGSLKREAGIATLIQISALRGGGFSSKPAAAALTKGFLAEVRPVLLTALEGKKGIDSSYDFERTNAWQMLKSADALKDVSVWDFHRQTLLTYGGRFMPPVIKEAIDFFAAHADTAKARGALREAKTHFEALRAAEVKRQGSDSQTYVRDYLLLFDKALAS